MNQPSLRELFDEASQLAPAGRAGIFERCVDAAMRAQLERLLAADTAQGNTLLDRGAAELARTIGDADAVQALPAGTRIGPFELVEVLGEGGSSTVFRASRVVEGVRQDVALKLLRHGLYSPDAQRQFRRERVALGQLDHPGIARLIEGGVTDTGIAYIALDLVDGLPITEHARQRRLDLRQRLALFGQVCRAVEAAHRALIVHRDLKPSNVLVTPAGQVKLLDFGIAKLLDTDEETKTHQPAFTPAYAAPEQRSGALVTTATDVYALGVLLGELITGQRLNDCSGRTPSGRIDGDAKPGVLPSAPHTTRRQLRGDLDNIVLKAIDDDPARRYASAGALADDVERLLDGRPVAAHPPSRWYRARKFVARHKGSVATTLAFLLAIFAALGVAAWQGHVAVRELERANAMRDFMIGAFVEAEPGAPREGPPRITEVVEKAISRARTDARMNPAVRTELLTHLGDVLRVQGRLQSAKEALAWNYDQAVAAFGESSVLAREAGLPLFDTLIIDGDFAEARKLGDELLERTPASETRLRTRLLGFSALLATKQDQRHRAVQEGGLAVELARASGDGTLLYDALAELGNVQLTIGEAKSAIATFEEVLRFDQREIGTEHLDTAAAHASLSRAYRRIGDPAAAEAHARAALSIDDAVLSKDDWRRTYHLNALMMVQLLQRDFRGALESAKETLRIDRIAFPVDEAANELNSIGMLNFLVEDYAAAVAPLREALQLTADKFGDDSSQSGFVRANYAIALAYSGDVASGVAEWHRAIVSLEAATEPDFNVQATMYEKLARFRLDRHDATAALPLIARVESLQKKAEAADPNWPARAGALHAAALLLLGRPSEAQTVLAGATEALAKVTHPDAVLAVELPLMQARAAADLDAPDAGRSMYARAHAMLMTLRNPPSRLVRLDHELQGP